MYTFFSLIGGGTLGGVAASVPGMWWLVFFAPLPLLFCIYKKENSSKKTFLYGWVFGTALMASTLYWFFNTLPLTWLGISDPLLSVLMVGLFWLILSLLLGLVIGIWSVVIHKLLTRTPLDVVLISFSWVLFEYLRMWFYAVVTYGPGALIEPHFSFGFLGYPLAHSSLMLPLAQFGGVYTLSFTVIVISVSFFFFFVLRQRRFAGVLIVLFVATTITSHAVLQHTPVETSQIAIVQTNFEPKLEVDAATREFRQKVLRREVRTIAENNSAVSVIVLPEASRFLQDLGNEKDKFFEELFGTREVFVIDSWRTEGETGAHNEIVAYSTTQGVLGTQNKRFLLVFGEYMPSVGEFILRLIGLGEKVDAIKHNRTYQASNTLQTFSLGEFKVGALTCSELVSPSLYRTVGKKHEVDVLINVSSQSWFHHGNNPFNQLVAMAKIQAVWNKKQYLQASNAAPLLHISSTGEVLTR